MKFGIVVGGTKRVAAGSCQV